MPRESAPEPPAPGQDRPCAHQTPDVEQRPARRTAASGAAFLLPHLRAGTPLLDCGRGVGAITPDLAGRVGR